LITIATWTPLTSLPVSCFLISAVIFDRSPSLNAIEPSKVTWGAEDAPAPAPVSALLHPNGPPGNVTAVPRRF